MPYLHVDSVQADPAQLQSPLLREMSGQDAAGWESGVSLVQVKGGSAGRQE